MLKDDQVKKVVNHVSPKPLPHLYQSILVEEYANDESFREGTKYILDEGDVMLEELIET